MPRRINAEEQRRKIARSAFRVLARDGLEGLSMRKVAKEAGCTIGLINHWFSSKDDLVMAAWQETVSREDRRADVLRAHDQFSADEVLLGSLPTTAELRNEELVYQAFAVLSVSNRSVRKAYTRRYDDGRRVLARALAGDGSPAKQDEETADLLIAAADGVAKMAALNPAKWPPTRQRAVLRRLIDPHLKPRSRQNRRVKSTP